MTVATKEAAQKEPAARPALSSKARELMEQLNTDAASSFVWVRTQMNSPAQRPWFTDSGGVSGAGHISNVEQPAAFTGAIRDFLSRP